MSIPAPPPCTSAAATDIITEKHGVPPDFPSPTTTTIITTKIELELSVIVCGRETLPGAFHVTGASAMSLSGCVFGRRRWLLGWGLRHGFFFFFFFSFFFFSIGEHSLSLSLSLHPS